MWNRLKEIYEYRDMIAGLVHRDLRGRYKGSFMGFLWNFINPLCQILVYILVFSMIYRSNLDKYYVFLIVGMMPWNFFSESIGQGAGCVFAQGDMVKKIYFPREVLVISTVTSRFVNFLINYLVAFAIILFSGLGFQFRIILMYLPAIMILEYIFTLGLALILASTDVYFRDIEYMTGVVTMAWIWLTPIMYPMDLVPPELRRKNLFPAGRLDKDTEGFVLITDDGAFAHRILAPKNKLPKRYTAVLDHRLDPAVIGEFEKGVDIGGGDHTLPAELTILENGENPRVSVIICEGMYHQIKRMFERFGYQVIYLKREQIGGLPLDPALPKGACRELTDEELRRLEEKEGEDAQ